MKKKFFTVNSSLLLVFLMFSSASADYSRNWTKQYGTVAGEEGNAVAIDTLGDIYVVGTTDGDLDGNTNLGGDDIFLSKFSSNGSKYWTKQYGSTGYDRGNSVATDSDGNVFVTGYTGGNIDDNTVAGNSDVFLSKFDSTGTRLWTKQFGDSNSEEGLSVATDESGNVYVTGYAYIFNGFDIFLTKFDNSGNMLWYEAYGSTLGERGASVAVDGNGNIYITGRTTGDLDGNANSGGYDIFLSKFSADGNRMWTEQYGTSSNDEGRSVATDSAGNIYVTGLTWGAIDDNTNMSENDDIFLTKFDSNGDRLWTNQYGGRGSPNTGNSVAVDSSDRSDRIYVTGLIVGTFEGGDNPHSEIFLSEFGGNGIRYWTKKHGSAATDEGRSIAISENKNIYISGVTFGEIDDNTYNGGGDIFLTKFTPISLSAIYYLLLM